MPGGQAFQTGREYRDIFRGNMIYTFGYQGKTLDDFAKILAEKQITHVIDIRARPFSRKAHLCFSRNKINYYLGTKNVMYHCWGKFLGGFSEISEKAIRELAQFQQDKTCLLMCMEADYKKCHRHYEIGKRILKYDCCPEIRHFLPDGTIKQINFQAACAV